MQSLPPLFNRSHRPRLRKIIQLQNNKIRGKKWKESLRCPEEAKIKQWRGNGLKTLPWVGCMVFVLLPEFNGCFLSLANDPFFSARPILLNPPSKRRSSTAVLNVAKSLQHAEPTTIKFTQNSQILFGPDHDRKTAEVSSRSRIFGTINYWWHSGRQLLHWTWLLSLCLSPVPFLGRRIIHSYPIHSPMFPILLDRSCLWKNKPPHSTSPFFCLSLVHVLALYSLFLFLSCLLSLLSLFTVVLCRCPAVSHHGQAKEPHRP